MPGFGPSQTGLLALRKEIEEDQNTALGVIVGSVIIGLAIVIAASIHGGTTVVYEAPAAPAGQPAAPSTTPSSTGG